MLAKEIMTPNPVCVTPDSTAQEAASLMAQHDCGVLPVVELPHIRRVWIDRQDLHELIETAKVTR